MAITKTIQPYEVLFRFWPGQPVAAHVQRLQIIKDGDDVISETVLPAITLTEDMDEFAEAVAAFNAAAVAERDALVALTARAAAPDV